MVAVAVVAVSLHKEPFKMVDLVVEEEVQEIVEQFQIVMVPMV